MRKRWVLHAEPIEGSGAAESLADAYNEEPGQYWTHWGARRAAAFYMYVLGIPVLLTPHRVRKVRVERRSTV